jgi:C-terminal processing protease CtpA/Prc
MSHSETVEINLKIDESLSSNGTFGFTLQGAGIIMSSSHLNDSILQNIPSYPVIGYVEPNSPAERSGLVQPGDRIILINGKSVEGMSLEDVRQLIRESGRDLKLEVEFDVADTIMLTSGTFQVKLLKKNLDLGINVTCNLNFTKSLIFFIIN